jgi:head-tail adaptor
MRFERRTGSPDGAGNTVETWAPLCGPFSARLRPINGKEEVLAGKLAGIQPYEIVVRYCRDTAGITPEDRAIDCRSGQRFDLAAIQNTDERRMWLSILAKAGGVEQ